MKSRHMNATQLQTQSRAPIDVRLSAEHFFHGSLEILR